MTYGAIDLDKKESQIRIVSVANPIRAADAGETLLAFLDSIESTPPHRLHSPTARIRKPPNVEHSAGFARHGQRSAIAHAAIGV